MPKYNKTIIPPEEAYVLETHTGLKYWKHENLNMKGRQRSVFTEDASISMHAYTGGREQGSTYLYEYNGFRIGFFCQEIDFEITKWHCYPAPEAPVVYDKKAMTYTKFITDIGTFVYDLGADTTQNKFVTGLSISDYEKGLRDKFESREQQDEMMNIWLELFSGFRVLKNLPEGTYAYRGKFSDKVLEKLNSGEMVK